MPFSLTRNEITSVECGCITVPTDRDLCPEGLIRRDVMKKTGRRILKDISKIRANGYEKTAVIDGAGLLCRDIILAPVPEYGAGTDALRALYTEVLGRASALGHESVAVPLLGTGKDGYSRKDSFAAAAAAVREYLAENDLHVILVLNTADVFEYGSGSINDIREFIYGRTAEKEQKAEFMMLKRAAPNLFHDRGHAKDKVQSFGCAASEVAAVSVPLEEYIKNTDKGFSETLLDLIDKSGMTDVQCYKRANVDRKLFSKIRSAPDYRPKKTTVLSFCIALSLSLEQTKKLLEKAGYALSPSSKGDLIIEYFIKQGKYDIFEINEALFAFDQALLGV